LSEDPVFGDLTRPNSSAVKAWMPSNSWPNCAEDDLVGGAPLEGDEAAVPVVDDAKDPDREEPQDEDEGEVRSPELERTPDGDAPRPAAAGLQARRRQRGCGVIGSPWRSAHRL